MLELPINFDANSNDLIVAIDVSEMKVSNRGEWIQQARGKRIEQMKFVNTK